MTRQSTPLFRRRWQVLLVLAVFAFAYWHTLYVILPGINRRPDNVGVQQRTPCAEAANCVTSYGAGSYADLDPLPYMPDNSTPDNSFDHLHSILVSLPGTTVITAAPDYIYAEVRSGWLGFTDDMEFWLDDAAQVIHFRSASRLGISDGGANERRMQKVRQRYLGANLP